MSSIIPFLDESDALFTQEEFARARTMVGVMKKALPY